MNPSSNDGSDHQRNGVQTARETDEELQFADVLREEMEEILALRLPTRPASSGKNASEVEALEREQE
jgi:hypothetical protein